MSQRERERKKAEHGREFLSGKNVEYLGKR